MEAIQNETLLSLLEELGLSEQTLSPEIEKLVQVDNKYIRDLKINVLNALNYQNLTKKESFLIALATAINEKQTDLKNAFERLAIKEGVTQEELAEVIACVSLLNVNNIFYRFRHFTNKEYYTQTPAGIKMTLMANPILGKEFFELVSLAVSALNGCEMCVNAHEESVIKHGSSEARIYDAIRLTASIKGLTAIL